jgi:hypothetical protein
MLIQSGALKVEAEGMPWPLVGVLFVLVHVLGPPLWVYSWVAYKIRGPGE